MSHRMITFHLSTLTERAGTPVPASGMAGGKPLPNRAHIAQLAERILGKDKVPGSIPGVGSILRRSASGGAMQNSLCIACDAECPS